ncbi:uncharacterized protein LOC135487816 [Lineus longissimus]|uniref:uncharacterized protein LOC135487816 n=1 Tax=Lineus longissimus TaxID=88925 RepID=UPI00315D7F99
MDDANIPVVDFSCCRLGTPPLNSDGEVLDVVKQIKKAFNDSGFVYLKNHGIDQSLVDAARSVSLDFFMLPNERKQRYRRPGDKAGTDGWKPMPGEKGTDIKENYNYTQYSKATWPEDGGADVPTFCATNAKFFEACSGLSLKVLQVLGKAFILPPSDEEFFAKSHQNMGHYDKNRTRLKSIYYPPLLEAPQPGKVRLAEHKDFGTITLLFQDNIGGLEIELKSGEYKAVVPEPCTILVMAGQLMERWTADKIRAPRHQVLIPMKEYQLKNGRQSLAFFAHPDNDVTISCLDGSNKYEPINALDWKESAGKAH